jgi:DNA-binding transcriptional MerR regulator
MLKIKDFSIETGFSIRMLRYLEEVGVLIPLRDTNKYRVYSKEQISEALWIKKLQSLGVQLKEIEKLNHQQPDVHLSLLKKVLIREQEIAEIKSESIPILKSIISYLSMQNSSIQEYFKNDNQIIKKMKTLGGDKKFHRTAYSIPILKNIYEDHLTCDADIDLISTDLMKFGEWIKGCQYKPEVFCILQETSFAFGHQVSQDFLRGYELSWKKFLPEIGFAKLEGFDKGDIIQLMGPHDIIIRSLFKYKGSGIEGEIIIPYAPVFTMSQLSNKR